MSAPLLNFADTDKQLARLRQLVQEAHDIGGQISNHGHVDIRFEATNLVAGIDDVAFLLSDLTIALRMAESEAGV